MENISFRLGMLDGPRQAVVKTTRLQPLEPDEILLKLEVCNICTADFNKWNGRRDGKYPLADGHEFCGIVVEKGPAVPEDYPKIGERVGFCTQRSCGYCPKCLEGKTDECMNFMKLAVKKWNDGYPGNHGFGQYTAIDWHFAVSLPKEIPAEEAAFLEPAATVVRGLRRIDVRPEDTVTVIGLGTMGMLNAQIARAFGARVIVSDLSPKKLARAKEAGFKYIIDAAAEDPVEAVMRITEGAGADKVVVTAGVDIAFKQAFDMVTKGFGSVLFFAANFPPPKMDIQPNDIHYRKMKLIGTLGGGKGDFHLAARLIGDGQIDCKFCLEGKTFPLEQLQDAYEAACEHDAYRVSVRLNET